MHASGDDSDFSSFDGRSRHGISVLHKAFDVESNCFSDQSLKAFLRFSCCNASRKVWDIGGPVALPLLVNHRVFKARGLHSFSSSACRRIDLSVLGCTSSEGAPATVTVPLLTRWRNCRWLPRVRSRYQPSFCSRRRTSRIFIVTDHNRISVARLSRTCCVRMREGFREGNN